MLYVCIWLYCWIHVHFGNSLSLNFPLITLWKTGHWTQGICQWHLFQTVQKWHGPLSLQIILYSKHKARYIFMLIAHTYYNQWLIPEPWLWATLWETSIGFRDFTSHLFLFQIAIKRKQMVPLNFTNSSPMLKDPRTF